MSAFECALWIGGVATALVGEGIWRFASVGVLGGSVGECLFVTICHCSNYMLSSLFVDCVLRV